MKHDPAEYGQSPSGVDVTALREQLMLTYTERLQWLDRAVASLDELQRAAGVTPLETPLEPEPGSG